MSAVQTVQLEFLEFAIKKKYFQDFPQLIYILLTLIFEIFLRKL